jgi:hypothetical protein
MSGCAEKHATSMASYFSASGDCLRTRMQHSEDRMASVADSMADGEGLGAVKPATVQSCGREEARVEMHAAVMLGVELGLIRRIEMLGWGLPRRGSVKSDSEAAISSFIVDVKGWSRETNSKNMALHQEVI